MLCVKQSLVAVLNSLYVKSYMSTRAMLSALNHGGRISQRGDIASAEKLRCATPWVEDLALNRSFVLHGARRCGEIGTIVRRKKLCEEREPARRAQG